MRGTSGLGNRIEHPHPLPCQRVAVACRRRKAASVSTDYSRARHMSWLSAATRVRSCSDRCACPHTVSVPGLPYRCAVDIVRRLTSSDTQCGHVPEAPPEPQADQCQECQSSFNLRLCASCGHVGCCESQRGDARAHALAEGHPVIYQMPAPNGFIWCYADQAYVG